MPEEVTFRRLDPVGELVDAATIVAALELPENRPLDRPYTLVNFVVSADGRATVDGRSGGLGDAGDKAIFHALRERVDAVLAGTGTLRAERYGRILGQAARRERRVAAGRSPEPLAVTVSRSGRVPLEIPLFAEPEARIVVFTPGGVPMDGVAAQVRWEALDVDAPLAGALRTLRRADGVRTLLCEGGPTLFTSLLHEGLVDELFLTLAPQLVGGGDATAITNGPPLPAPGPLRLVAGFEREGTLFLRYAVKG
jgi:riboflavin biosynthesis pyrimidine reductase